MYIKSLIDSQTRQAVTAYWPSNHNKVNKVCTF